MLDANELPGGSVQLVLKGYHEKTCPKPAGQVGWECQWGVPASTKIVVKNLEVGVPGE